MVRPGLDVSVRSVDLASIVNVKSPVNLGNVMTYGEKRGLLDFLFKGFIDSFSPDKCFSGPVDFMYGGH